MIGLCVILVLKSVVGLIILFVRLLDFKVGVVLFVGVLLLSTIIGRMFILAIWWIYWPFA